LAGEFTKTESYKIAFVLTEGLLRDCVETIKQELEVDPPELAPGSSQLEPITFDVNLVKGGSFATDSLDDVLALSNSGQKQIEGIEIRTSYWASPRTSLRFRVSDLNNVSYRVTGDDRRAFFMASRLEDAISRTKVWYSRIAHADIVQLLMVALGVLAALYLAVAGVYALLGRIGDTPTSPRQTAIANLIVYGTVAALVLSGILANRLKKWLFPTGLFAFGDQLERLNRLRFWRSVLGVSVVLAFVTNIATTLMFQ